MTPMTITKRLLTAFGLTLAFAVFPPHASRAGEKPPAIQRDLSALPDAVRATRAAILEAARTGNVEEVRGVMEMNELMPMVSFGGASDPVRFWRETSDDKTGREYLAAMVEILQMPFVHLGKGTSNEIFVWPYLAQLDLEKLTPAQEVDLYRLVSPDETKTMRDFGGYIWYRLGIGPDGTWHFFVAGD